MLDNLLGDALLPAKHTPPFISGGAGGSKPLASSAVPFGMWLLWQTVLAFNFRRARGSQHGGFSIHSGTGRVALLPEEECLPWPACSPGVAFYLL